MAIRPTNIIKAHFLFRPLPFVTSIRPICVVTSNYFSSRNFFGLPQSPPQDLSLHRFIDKTSRDDPQRFIKLAELLEMGASLKDRDKKGRTPLERAFLSEDQELGFFLRDWRPKS